MACTVGTKFIHNSLELAREFPEPLQWNIRSYSKWVFNIHLTSKTVWLGRKKSVVLYEKSFDHRCLLQGGQFHYWWCVRNLAEGW